MEQHFQELYTYNASDLCIVNSCIAKIKAVQDLMDYLVGHNSNGNGKHEQQPHVEVPLKDMTTEWCTKLQTRMNAWEAATRKLLGRKTTDHPLHRLFLSGDSSNSPAISLPDGPFQATITSVASVLSTGSIEVGDSGADDEKTMTPLPVDIRSCLWSCLCASVVRGTSSSVSEAAQKQKADMHTVVGTFDVSTASHFMNCNQTPPASLYSFFRRVSSCLLIDKTYGNQLQINLSLHRHTSVYFALCVAACKCLLQLSTSLSPALGKYYRDVASLIGHAPVTLLHCLTRGPDHKQLYQLADTHTFAQFNLATLAESVYTAIRLVSCACFASKDEKGQQEVPSFPMINSSIMEDAFLLFCRSVNTSVQNPTLLRPSALDVKNFVSALAFENYVQAAGLSNPKATVTTGDVFIDEGLSSCLKLERAHQHTLSRAIRDALLSTYKHLMIGDETGDDLKVLTSPAARALLVTTSETFPARDLLHASRILVRLYACYVGFVIETCVAEFELLEAI